MHLAFLLQLGSTLALFGLIWFVQIVHYPLHALVGPVEFPRYEAEHATRTGYIAAPLMILELATTAAILLPRFRPPSVPALGAWLGFVLVLLLWLSTFFIQVPLHNRLHRTRDGRALQLLVRTNWIRTLLWTLRAVLVLFWCPSIWRFFDPAA